MKKSLLALATMGAFAGAAQAQSSVSVYGLIDGGYNNINTTESTAAGVKQYTQGAGYTGGESASSRIGFRGVEDLGQGLSANFNLEYGVAPGTGTTTVASDATGLGQGSATGVRASIVGLAHKQYGSVAVGRQLTGMHAILAGDVWASNNMVGDITYTDFVSTAAGAGVTASNRINFITTRSSNMLTYISPNLMGLTLRAEYGNTQTTTANQPGIQFSLGGVYATYQYGPFTVKAGQIQAKSNEAIAAAAVYAASKTTVNGANVMYKDKALTVQYTVGNNKTEALAANGVAALTSGVRAQKLSASYQIGAFLPFVQYGQGASEGVRTAANTSTNDKGLQVGSEYALSKRSNLYAAYGNQERALKTNSSAKTERTELSVGLRHTF